MLCRTRQWGHLSELAPRSVPACVSQGSICTSSSFLPQQNLALPEVPVPDSTCHSCVPEDRSLCKRQPAAGPPHISGRGASPQAQSGGVQGQQSLGQQQGQRAAAQAGLPHHMLQGGPQGPREQHDHDRDRDREALEPEGSSRPPSSGLSRGMHRCALPLPPPLSSSVGSCALLEGVFRVLALNPSPGAGY